MTPANDQLISCDVEPIHIPGKIQDHGYLVAVEEVSFLITYISDNISVLSGDNAAAFLGKPLDTLLAQCNIQLRNAHLLQLRDFITDESGEKLAPLNVKIGNTPYFLLGHRSGDQLVMEFEPADLSGEIELQRVIGASVSQILEGSTLQRALQNAAKKVKEIIRYERVMIYKFWEDGHGEVIAEEKTDELESWMGLHYPASDIPKQARELYKINLTRIIVDTTSAPVNISALATKGQAAAALDLTHSTLRAVSPIHIEYLKNMEVAASFSISLVVNNKLWGLIACHNSTRKFIDYKSREAAKLIGQILSSSIEYKEGEEGKDETRQYTMAMNALLRQLQTEDDIASALTAHQFTLLNVTAAKGAAVVFNKQVYLIGETPSVEEVGQIAAWLNQHNNLNIFSTNTLQKEFPEAAAFSATCSGLLACALSKEMGEYMLWFKPELAKVMNWAGNPDKPSETDANGLLKISPRRSFAIWTEQVKGSSEPWSRAEFTTVLKLREDVIQVLNLKSNQIRLLNEKLKEAYDELDTFSFTISHDLKTPLASIKNYTEILLEENTAFTDDEKFILSRIIKGAEKMNTLIDEVLAYSRIGRKPLNRQSIDTGVLLDDIKKELLMAYNNFSPEIIIKNTPAILGDKTMIGQVFSNLLSNAVKYSSKTKKPVVTVDAEDFPHETVYSIKDNGIGIDISFGNQIYEIFKRLNNVAGFEGSGIGLSIVKRIIEKHHAKIWYESELGVGTVFYIAFSKI